MNEWGYIVLVSGREIYSEFGFETEAEADAYAERTVNRMIRRSGRRLGLGFTVGQRWRDLDE